MPKYMETTADKFTFRVATDRLYAPEGVWALTEADGKRVRVGLADYLRPRIRISAGGESKDAVEHRTRRALQAARKYSLVANSVKSEVVLEPEILVEA
jgi:hypothetical protein